MPASETMKNHMTTNEFQRLGKLILLHAQKVIDYTRAVPSPAMARYHSEAVELLKKAQTLLHGNELTCAGCVREGKDSAECKTCGLYPKLTDNFKRSKAG